MLADGAARRRVGRAQPRPAIGGDVDDRVEGAGDLGAAIRRQRSREVGDRVASAPLTIHGSTSVANLVICRIRPRLTLRVSAAVNTVDIGVGNPTGEPGFGRSYEMFAMIREMVRRAAAGDAERTLERTIGMTVREGRRSLGWTQSQLAARAILSRSQVAMIEGGRTNVTLAAVGGVLDALRARPDLRIEMPHLADRRSQREPVHARCVGHVRRRLEAAGWQVATEVEVAGLRSIGWIDVIAWDSMSGILLVAEVKTELHDVGRIDRTQSWYERAAPASARTLGWRARRVVGLLLLLETEVNDDRIRLNREVLAGSFPARKLEIERWLTQPERWPPGRRGLAMIDPRSRGKAWLRATRTDGRRSKAPYRDYAGFIRSSTHPPSTLDRARRLG
jgi:transcriptional regulator with XRE-family HTH domain